MKILIVDDNQCVRETIRFFLACFAREVREVNDGSQALGAYQTFLPDFVLMDWQMSQMDGLTATRGIIERFPQAQILIVTQYDDDQLRRAAREAGAVGFFAKDDLRGLRSLLQAV